MSHKSSLMLVMLMISISFLLIASVATADFTASGTIDDLSGCMSVSLVEWYPADVQSFTAAVTGDYTVTYQSHTWMDFFYSYVVVGTYDPTVVDVFSQGGQQFSSDGPTSITVSVTAGQTVYLATNNNQWFTDQVTCENRTGTDSGDYVIYVTEPVGGGGAVGPVVEEPVPGCDVTIAIPSTAVGATITADTPVYWAPGEPTSETFPAGLTLRAIGVDESGAYTKVLYACGYYWVPTGVIGPNYDAVWNGAPLPTDVVD